MSDIVLLYLFTRLDSIGRFLTFLTMIGMVATALTAVIGFFYQSEDPDAYGGHFASEARRHNQQAVALFSIAKRAGAAALCSAILCMAVPSKADMALIVGGKIALDASRTDTAKEISQEVLDAIRAQLKKAKE